MRRNFVVIPALLIALVGAGASAFAQPPRDNGLVYIYGTEALPPAILTFAPGNPSPLFVTEITENTSQPVYSATGDHSAFVTYGEAGQILRYGQLGQPFAEISAPAGWDFYAPTFSPDNARLAYSLVNWGEMRWQLALVEVATEAAIVFEGQIDLAASDATGPTTLPITPLGWRADNQALYIVGIVPDGYATPPYALDLSNLSYTGGAQNIPPQEVLLDAEAMNLPMQFRLSPAGTHLLFSYYDPARPITTPSDMMLPTNALGILDLASKAITFVPLEGEGELVLGVNTWSLDGQSVLFSVGALEVLPQTGLAVLTDTKIFRYDLAGGQVQTLLALGQEGAAMLLPCTDTLYYVTTPAPDAAKYVFSLYSMPLAGGAAQQLAQSDAFMAPLACVGS
jgi:hypothetical protein